MSATKEQQARGMAERIVAKVREHGCCSDDDLLQAGYTPDELQRVGPLAKGFAAVELTRKGDAA